ncbi:RrF2 family transcriptional regulator [Pelotomaculum propionicicum]|uniref:Putative HTH-type transcriptional regulator n=1 Tax=Pelotomaculum propionicicum TaxID=258475 RepID=A0A4Y7RQF7_9FIRM|nr:Rrf2 family transcriptional regulator [Pelotomaculum propionicicum]NLI13752.1 Rrf2 family transcriptional regulator [Peptococcaceae bacterium]TEB10497.1 putative HTH-type transcriptional regulator [Pelotomaculum propionicicum]
MQLTRKTEYAVRTLLELVSRPWGELVQTCEIAETKDIPEPFLNKTIRDLARAGFVETRRGKMGGVRLIKPGDSFTMADVVETIEGPLAINPCLRDSYSCINKSSCSVRQFLMESQARFVEHLNSKTFAELIGQDCEK